MTRESVCIISKQTIRPSPPPEQEEGRRRIIHLTPWDLRSISVDYIQKGLLFHRPSHHHGQQHLLHCENPTISTLLSSFALALNHFFPLAGRLSTTKHDTSPPSLTVFLNCNDEGAEFIHASAPLVTVSDILSPLFIPTIINRFFPLNGLINHDGHSAPLFAVQVTELADGIFIGCSLNHVVADGTSLWHFINSWSEISRSSNTSTHISLPPVLDRWFVDSYPPPMHLPFSDADEFIKRPTYGPVSQCFLNFSRESLAKLKAKANSEMNTTNISTLQALLAHVWLAATRARGLNPNQKTSYAVMVGNRTRVNPPMPESYLGNTVSSAVANSTAGEILGRGLGWTASLLNQAVASMTEEVVRGLLAAWTSNPAFVYIDHFGSGDLLTGSSPRFNVYGNDFGWGRPVTVRSGCGNKFDGKVTVYPGRGGKGGSMALEVCLLQNVLEVLVEDEEFMEAVSAA